MHNEIISRLVEFRENNEANWCFRFTDMYTSNAEQFSDTLVELRNTNLECIDDEELVDKINNCSSLFSGRDIIFLDVILLMLYFEIDIQDNINIMLSNYQFPEFEKQSVVMSSIYYMYLTKVFTKNFTIHSNDKLVADINSYFDVDKINTVSLAELYYSVIRDIKPRSVKNLPKKIFYVGMVCQAFGLIDGDGLSCFYRHFKADSITTICEFLKSNGGERYADIIMYGIEFRKDSKKLDHLDNKIYQLEKKIPINDLLSNYLEVQQ